MTFNPHEQRLIREADRNDGRNSLRAWVWVAPTLGILGSLPSIIFDVMDGLEKPINRKDLAFWGVAICGIAVMALHSSFRRRALTLIAKLAYPDA